jgi:hypothetical protein
MDVTASFVLQIMMREMHEEILSNLHVNDSLGMLMNKDRICKLCPLIIALNENFHKCRLPD